MNKTKKTGFLKKKGFNIVTRFFLCSFFVISFFYVAPIFINFADNMKYLIFQKRPKSRRKFYFKPNSLFWWRRFNKLAVVKIKPWRTFSAKMQKIIIPNNNFGKKLFELLFLLEEKIPSIFVFLGTYPIIIITKK